MKNCKMWLATGTGLGILLGLWLMLSGGLSPQVGGVAAAWDQPLPDTGAGVVIADTRTYATAIYLPLIEHALLLPEQIAFETLRDGNYEIYLMNPDGSGQTNLTQNPAKDVAPAWSPDGRQVAFVSDRDGDEEIYVMNRDGTGIVQLTNNSFEDDWPTWSPDGVRIAFQSGRGDNWDIYVMNADGSGQTQITDHPAHDRWPDWSPDGDWITFASIRIYKKIFVMRPDGGGLRMLSDPNGYYTDRYPTWSPDGRITFVSDQPAPSDGSRDDEIYIMEANGANVQQLTDNDAGDWLARWSPDGTRFAFYTDRDRNKNIYVKTLATGAETQITNNPGDEEYPAWSP